MAISIALTGFAPFCVFQPASTLRTHSITVRFKCPTCDMHLQAEPEMSGKMVRCPSCQTKMQIPDFAPPPPSNDSMPWGNEKQHEIAGGGAPGRQAQAQKPQRSGWAESDPTNPNMFVAFGIGMVVTVVWLAILYPLQPPATRAVADYSGLQILANLFYKHLLVSAVNTLFFGWAMAILWLKIQKLRHQKEALLLDVLPRELGVEIKPDNVHLFIENVYALPPRLRDSLMVNRIRKALELYETRPNVSEVGGQMSSQSDIDSARIGSSFAMLRAFLWAIPILGFIGTVLGLSHAISGMNFANVDDVSAIIGSINNVTSGLGTAFDATLLGLVLAMFLNFPLNAMIKAEDDNLNQIDAFCNDVMLPRLSDAGSGGGLGDKFGGGETGAFVEALVTALGTAQQELLTDLKAVTESVREQSANLDKRADAHAVLVATEFSKTMLKMREEMGETVNASVAKTTEYVRTLASALQGLNSVLKDLGEKQVIIQQTKKRGWFGN